MTTTIDDEWVVFTGKSRTRRNELSVSTQAKGMFLISEAAMNALGNPEALEFLWNPSKRRIGFRGADPKAAHSYVVRRQEKGTNYHVNGKAFMVEHGIPLDRTYRYSAQLLGDVLVIELETVETADPQANRHQAEPAGAKS